MWGKHVGLWPTYQMKTLISVFMGIIVKYSDTACLIEGAIFTCFRFPLVHYMREQEYISMSLAMKECG